MKKLEKMLSSSDAKPKGIYPWSSLFEGYVSAPPKHLYGQKEDLSYFPRQGEYYGYVPFGYAESTTKKAA